MTTGEGIIESRSDQTLDRAVAIHIADRIAQPTEVPGYAEASADGRCRTGVGREVEAGPTVEGIRTIEAFKRVVSAAAGKLVVRGSASLSYHPTR